jgi:hypothetical protein
MTTCVWPVLRALLSTTTLLILSQGVSASGYHPSFDRAIKEATIVALGTTVDAWDPKTEGKLSEVDSLWKEGRAYRMSVQRFYKGSLQPSEEVVFWDPYYMSTASYAVEEAKANLVFLVPAKLSEFEKKHLHFRTKALYRPIRCLSRRSDFRAEEFDGWLYLLNIALQQPPKDKKKAYGKILVTESNRYVLRYVIEHWPVPMTEDDDSLFQATIQKHLKDAFVTSPAIEKLCERGIVFKDEVLVPLLENGSEYQREELLRMVTPQNIGSCEAILFAWLMEEEPEPERETTVILAKLCPEYFKKQLRRHEMPFWKLIPCLQELRINGSDVGKKDFSKSVLSINTYTIRKIGEVFRGKEFHGVLAMENPERNKDWLVASSLLEPLLSGSDTPTRRLVVALLRTFGVPVKRDGKKYVASFGKAPVPKPVQLELETPKGTFSLAKPVNLVLKELVVADAGWISFQGQLGWAVKSVNVGSTMSGGAFGVWDDVDLPRDDFVQMTKGSVVKSKHNIHSLIGRPGTYKVSVKKTYSHDGKCIDVDSWTGVLVSNEVEIRVED